VSAVPPRPLLAVVCLAASTLCAGCAIVSVGKIPRQEGVYPAQTGPDTPLVLAIPGLRIPGLPVEQEQHFGFLVKMLAAEGIPCRVLAYDTVENPLISGAALFASDLAIAWTRVGPAVVREVQYENERRESLGLPPLRRLVLFGYSQGAVIMEQIACRVFFQLKRDYDAMEARFGEEWRALRQDPEFQFLMTALDDFLVIRNIKIQRQREFRRDPELRQFYQRAEDKLHRRLNDFIAYLDDPSSAYPEIDRFEEPGTPRYPKRYRELRLCAHSLQHCSLEERDRIRNFLIDYAQYHDLLALSPSFVSAAGSFFGSPRANEGMLLFKLFPVLRLFARRELTQIAQTRIGTVYHLRNMEDLARSNRDERYPLDPDNTLCIVGVNGPHGDGIVDQSSAHLSDHAFEIVKAPRRRGDPAAVLCRDRLPDLTVVPLRVMHFPERALGGWGRRRFGAAYMEEENPAFDYLRRFLRGDWDGLRLALGREEGSLRQFMLTLAFEGEAWKSPSPRRRGQSRNIRVDGRYDNPADLIFTWTGHFTAPGEEMNLVGPETAEGTLTIEAAMPYGERLQVPFTVYPGCNSFVKIVH